MRLGTIAGMLAGLGLIAFFVVQADIATLLGAVSQVGLAIPAIIVVRAGVVVLAGLGWAPLVTAPGRAGLSVLVGLRFVREAVNVMLPVAAVGGDLVGGRLLTRWAVPPGAAGASILSDLLIQFFAQLLFAVLGVLLLAASGKGGAVVAWALPGLGIASLALAGFFATQRLGLFRLVEVGLEWIARRWPAASLGNGLRLHDNLRTIYSRPSGVTLATALHLTSWLLGTLESFIVLTAAGADPGAGQALVIESLGQAIRGSAFPVPWALGVQEGGYVLIGGLYGISPEICLALSLAKRVPDFVIGLPGVLAWLGLESGCIGPGQARPVPILDHVEGERPT